MQTVFKFRVAHVMTIYICMLHAYITHVPRSRCTYVIHFRVTRMYVADRGEARQGGC